MAKDHFIPASLIARFSADELNEPRSRKVWTLRSGGQRANVRAETIGYSNNLYAVDGELFPTRGVRAVDDVWSTYEGNLPGALNRLIDGTTTAEEWIDTLVPFVAAAFARDRGYERRVASRVGTRSWEELRAADPDLLDLLFGNTNIALNRLIEMDRFAARALASDWVVYEIEGDIVLPDLGYGFDLIDTCPDVVALMLPIGKGHVLSLTPSAEHRILISAGATWEPCIAHAKSPSPAESVNRALARTAQDFVAGTLSAIDSIRSTDLGVFKWEEVEAVLSIWPFSVDTRNLIGLDRVVRRMIHGQIDSFDGVILNRYQSLFELSPELSLISPLRKIRADRFLSVDDQGGVLLTVDFPES